MTGLRSSTMHMMTRFSATGVRQMGPVRTVAGARFAPRSARRAISATPQTLAIARSSRSLVLVNRKSALSPLRRLFTAGAVGGPFASSSPLLFAATTAGSPTVGTPAPGFTLKDHNMNDVSLADFKGKNVVLAFFPAAFTGTCQKEICSFQNSLAKLNTANAVVLGLSVDAPFANAAFAKANKVDFPLLSDYTREAVRAYDVPIEDFAGLKGYTASKRATFLIDSDGKIAYSEVQDSPAAEPNYDALWQAIEKL